MQYTIMIIMLFDGSGTCLTGTDIPCTQLLHVHMQCICSFCASPLQRILYESCTLVMYTEGRTIPTELRADALELRKAMKYDDSEREGEFIALVWHA